MNRELQILNILTKHKEELDLLSAAVSFEDQSIVLEAKGYRVEVYIEGRENGTDGEIDQSNTY